MANSQNRRPGFPPGGTTGQVPAKLSNADFDYDWRDVVAGVSSVFGRTGAVVAANGDYTTDQVTEGLNLYFTNARADARITLQKGAANGLATLGADSKIPSSQIPALAITDTFVVASEAAQTALTAERGDVAVRTDENKSYILQVEPASNFANWVWLRTPTDTVLSVNGQTGAVVLTTSDVAEGTNLYYTAARFNTAFAAKSTSDLPEGTNLYFTNERVDDRVAAFLQAGTNISLVYDDPGNTLTINSTANALDLVSYTFAGGL